MKLKAIGFSSNRTGELRGTVIAYADSGEPLGVEHFGNYSRDGEKKLLLKLKEIGVDLEVARAQLRQLLAMLRRATDEASERGRPQRRKLPVVYTSGRQFREIVDDSWNLLVGFNQGVRGPLYFRMGDILVHLEAGIKQVYTRTLSVPSLRLHLDRLADFTRTDSDEEEHPARPPKDVLETMMAAVPYKILPLDGLVMTPFLAPSGEIVSRSGYHKPSSIYLAMGSLAVPPIPKRPGPQDVSEAKRIILTEVLGDFPFTSQADRANAVAAALTPVVRPSIAGPTPLFVFEAPIEGSGKGLAASVVSYIATGEAPPSRTEGRDEDEWRKRITSLLLKSPPIVLFDNLRRRLDSSALSSVITSTVWSDRMLGFSRDITLPVHTTWLATANNPSYSGEISRRIVRIRIDAGVEVPWERTDFRHPDLLKWVREERGRLIWAILVMVQAWITAGRPAGGEVMGSFENWASTIGGILREVGIPALLANRSDVYAQAHTESEPWRTLLEAWWDDYADRRVGVDQLRKQPWPGQGYGAGLRT